MTQPQLAQHRESQASPPDDGGDQGSYTRPEDTMVLPRNEPSPPDARPSNQQGDARSQGLMLSWIIGITLVVLLVMVVYLRGII